MLEFFCRFIFTQEFSFLYIMAIRNIDTNLAAAEGAIVIELQAIKDEVETIFFIILTCER